MVLDIERPRELHINAWMGSNSPQQDLPTRTPWAQMENIVGKTEWLAAPTQVDERNWRHPDVGWGLVLPDSDALPPAERAKADDLRSDVIKRLLQDRGDAPVLRWRKELGPGYLRRYYDDGSVHDLSAQAPNPGIGKGRVPRYLLIYASPADIPWAVQYALNMSSFVGRLDPTGPNVERYIEALISDWAGQTCDPRSPVVWSVDHGTGDITSLMARALAAKVWEKLDANSDLTKRLRLTDLSATREKLGAALAERSPALIITTSHGMTGPSTDRAVLRNQLGAPVDADYAVLGSQQLGEWQPAGAIWYAHACCSAGSDNPSRYKGLLSSEGAIGSMLNQIASDAGAMVAPLPHALLGTDKPLRAFVGHVEPTFDWTLRDPANKQVLTHVLCKALYDRLYLNYERNPIGWALQDVYKEAGSFFAAWRDAMSNIDKNVTGARDFALYRQLVAMDRQTIVILGDPTVSLPLVN